MKHNQSMYKKLAFHVSRETIERLDVYVSLLEKWNQKINLVSRQDIDNIYRRHVLDSLQLAGFIQGKATLLDMGSGGGFPAIVLGIATGISLTLVESDSRKAVFLREVIRTLSLSGEVLCQRMESVQVAPVDVVTARALAPLGRLLKWASPVLKKEGFCVFLKGKNIDLEIEEAKKDWSMTIEQFPSITSSEGFVVKVAQIEAV